MENIVVDVISNVGFPIAVSIALFYQMFKANETYVNLLREFQEVINNNTKSIELFNVTFQRLERDICCRGDDDEAEKSKD